MRRILKNIANNIFVESEMGDISTLDNPHVVKDLIEDRVK